MKWKTSTKTINSVREQNFELHTCAGALRNDTYESIIFHLAFGRVYASLVVFFGYFRCPFLLTRIVHLIINLFCCVWFQMNAVFMRFTQFKCSWMRPQVFHCTLERLAPSERFRSAEWGWHLIVGVSDPSSLDWRLAVIMHNRLSLCLCVAPRNIMYIFHYTWLRLTVI